ncbi:MAG: 2OG-Fe dioxygenase family protein, partial [Pseudomonadota bacterium]|nr:2OG-Fe dioxygenase family protein [Pseudomonadota bacterium]
MSRPPFTAPITPPDRVAPALRDAGHAVLDPRGFASLTSTSTLDFDALRPTWSDLPLDDYLRDGGHYRRRRHSCFVVRASDIEAVPHRAHWQPLEYNA